MSDYTPAPWKLEHLGEWWVAYGPGRVIFQVGAVDEIDEANARLIAASPELLAALIGLFDKLTVMGGCNEHDIEGAEAWPEFNAAVNAILKAAQ